MGKYNKYQRKTEEAPKIHPAWAGIGCIMILIVPVMSGAAAAVMVDLAKAQGWPIMSSLSGYVRLPDVFYTLPYISNLANYISSIPDFSALALFFVLIVLLLSGFLSLAYAMLYRIVGPPRYTSQDAPAQRVVTKRYKR